MGEVGVSMEAESSMVILVSSGLSPVESSSSGSVLATFLEGVKIEGSVGGINTGFLNL